jgi:hypothetical protein
MGLTLPASWFSHLADFETEAHSRLGSVTFLRLRSRFRVSPEIRARAKARAPTLPRFLVLTTQPTRRDPPLPGFACPGHVASPHLPCASTPFSLDELPGVLSTRRVLRTSPSRALPDRDRYRLSAELPLLRLAYRPLQQTLSLLCFAPPRDWPSRRRAHRTDQRRPIPLGSVVLRRFRRIGIAAAAASLQGFDPSAGWGSPPPDFSACGTLALLGFILPGAFPFRASASTVAANPHENATAPH